jgi:CRP/FNR family transcriptional regulator, cyclic AMP receptor protein
MNPFQQYPFFRGLRIHHLSLLIKCASEAKYETGATLFTAGQPAYRFFLIKSGSVALERHNLVNEKESTIIALSGDVLGRSWLTSHVQWPVTARALTPTIAMILSGARLMACAKEYPDFGAELMKRATQSEADGQLIERQSAEPPAETREWPNFQMDRDTRTVSAGKFAYSQNDTLDISLASAKKFFLHNGETVQLTTRHGSAILPIRIKDPNQPNIPTQSANI